MLSAAVSRHRLHFQFRKESERNEPELLARVVACDEIGRVRDAPVCLPGALSHCALVKSTVDSPQRPVSRWLTLEQTQGIRGRTYIPSGSRPTLTMRADGH